MAKRVDAPIWYYSCLPAIQTREVNTSDDEENSPFTSVTPLRIRIRMCRNMFNAPFGLPERALGLKHLSTF